MHDTAQQVSSQLVTPAGFVDAETATAADVIVWDDAIAVRAFLLSRDTSIRPRRRDTAA